MQHDKFKNSLQQSLHLLKKELADELKPLIIGFAVAVAMLQIAYYKENFATTLRTAASVYWLFVIPGYAVMLHWKEQLGIMERFAFGTVSSMVIVGVASYYLGLIGLKLQNQTLLLPAAIIVIALSVSLKFSGQKGQQRPQEQKQQQLKV